MSNQEEASAVDQERSTQRFERLTGITLAVFAAVLAVVDLGGGKYGDDEIISTNERGNLYQWYQSKSIKQSIAEQQSGLFSALLVAGAVDPKGVATIEKELSAANQQIARYDKEKKELLLGSDAVGVDGQVLEQDGQKGSIIGTKPLELRLATLAKAGDEFDLATLWLQLGLVMGAISLVVSERTLKTVFYCALLLGSIAGSAYGVSAFKIAMSNGAESSVSSQAK